MEILHPQESEALLTHYVQVFGDWCRKCRVRFELELIHLTPHISPLEEATLDEVMVVCSGCKGEMNLRLKQSFDDDLDEWGHSRKWSAAYNAQPHRYPSGHPALAHRVAPSVVDWEGVRKPPPKKKPQRKKKSELDGIAKRIGT